MHRVSIGLLILAFTLGGCAVPQPYKSPGQAPSVPVPPPPSPTQTQPMPEQPRVEEPQPLPPPVIREPSLGPASKALVDQARVQMASKNFAVAAGSIERALRIEPDNPLLWIELGKVRQAEGNYPQAENMARKAVSMSTNAPRAQSAAWSLIADSYRARGKNAEARDADLKAGNSSR
ncbi:MAG TPA: tetratricopeptide repeat protein [Steroidobacteraceae bacterium]|jgi:tetratricopeptide (TPR) repeat protein